MLHESEEPIIQHVENVSSIDLHGVKLPTINLPTVNGSSENWLGFRDSFESLIILNPKIGNVRASWKGEAFETIAFLKVCNQKCTIAWDFLCEWHWSTFFTSRAYQSFIWHSTVAQNQRIKLVKRLKLYGNYLHIRYQAESCKFGSC